LFTKSEYLATEVTIKLEMNGTFTQSIYVGISRPVAEGLLALTN